MFKNIKLTRFGNVKKNVAPDVQRVWENVRQISRTGRGLTRRHGKRTRKPCQGLTRYLVRPRSPGPSSPRSAHTNKNPRDALPFDSTDPYGLGGSIAGHVFFTSPNHGCGGPMFSFTFFSRLQTGSAEPFSCFFSCLVSRFFRVLFSCVFMFYS